MADFSDAEFLRRLKVYQTETEVLQHMIVPLCQWGNTAHETCVVNIVELAADYSVLGIGMFRDFWHKLRFFPALLLLYAGGLAAVSSENYGMLAALVNRPKYHDHEGEKSLCLTLSPRDVFGTMLGEARAEYKRFIGSSVYLSNLLRPVFKEIIPQQYRLRPFSTALNTFSRWPKRIFTRSVHRKRGFGIFSWNSADLSLEIEASPKTSSRSSIRRSKNSGTIGRL